MTCREGWTADDVDERRRRSIIQPHELLKFEAAAPKTCKKKDDFWGQAAKPSRLHECASWSSPQTLESKVFMDISLVFICSHVFNHGMV